MKTQVSRHLSSLADEIASTRARVNRLRDRLELQEATLDEQRLRMLMAETPLADRDLHAAAEGFHALADEVRRTEEALEILLEQRRLLSARLTTTGADR